MGESLTGFVQDLIRERDAALARAEKAESELAAAEERDTMQEERYFRTLAERDQCIEAAAKFIGSEYRNAGVVQAAFDYAEKVAAERDRLRDRVLSARHVILRAQEWAAGSPLGGEMEAIAAQSVYGETTDWLSEED